MMGRSHALSEAVVWLCGCAGAAVWGAQPAAGTVVVGAAVAAGAALLPDIDHPGSVVARSLGPVTCVIARGTAAGAAALRRSSCGCCTGRGGHRAVTHTLVFAVAAGLVVSLVCWLGEMRPRRLSPGCRRRWQRVGCCAGVRGGCSVRRGWGCLSG